MVAPPPAKEDRTRHKQQQQDDENCSPIHNWGANLRKNPHSLAFLAQFQDKITLIH
jgi:hypothetical protein